MHTHFWVRFILGSRRCFTLMWNTHTHRNRLPLGIHLWKATHAFAAYIPNAAWHLLYGWAGKTGLDSAIFKDKDKFIWPGLNPLYAYIRSSTHNVPVCYINVYHLGHFSVLWTMWSNESRPTLIFPSCQSRSNMPQTFKFSPTRSSYINRSQQWLTGIYKREKHQNKKKRKKIIWIFRREGAQKQLPQMSESSSHKKKAKLGISSVL